MNNNKPYEVKELIEAIEQVYEWLSNAFEVPQDIQFKMETAIKWLHSKEPKNIKPLPADKWEELPFDQKEAVSIDAKQLRDCINKPYLFKRTLASFMAQMYNFGIADALGGEPVDEGRCVIVDQNTIYTTVCPHCGAEVGVNMEDYIEQSGGYGVKV